MRGVRPLVRVKPNRGAIGKSQSPSDVCFGVWGRGIQSDASVGNIRSACLNSKVKHCRTLGATPTYSLSSVNRLPSAAISRPHLSKPYSPSQEPRPLQAHPPPQEPHSLQTHPSLLLNQRLFGGQRSCLSQQDVIGVAKQRAAPIGRLRKGYIAPLGRKQQEDYNISKREGGK